MALTKLILNPLQNGYGVTDGEEVVATQLDGGAARYRRDIIGATSRVPVSWTVRSGGYKYLRCFYKAIANGGATPFLIDLIMDEPTLTEHTAYFVPGSMRLTGVDGNGYTVSAELEVYPRDPDGYEADYVHMYNEFGEDFASSQYLDDLNTLVNVELPQDFSGAPVPSPGAVSDEGGGVITDEGGTIIVNEGSEP